MVGRTELAALAIVLAVFGAACREAAEFHADGQEPETLVKIRLAGTPYVSAAPIRLAMSEG